MASIHWEPTVGQTLWSLDEAISLGLWASLLVLVTQPRMQSSDHLLARPFLRAVFALCNLEEWSNISSWTRLISLLCLLWNGDSPSLVFPFCNSSHCVCKHWSQVLCSLRTQVTERLRVNGHEALATTFAMRIKPFVSFPAVLCLLPASLAR